MSKGCGSSRPAPRAGLRGRWLRLAVLVGPGLCARVATAAVGAVPRGVRGLCASDYGGSVVAGRARSACRWTRQLRSAGRPGSLHARLRRLGVGVATTTLASVAGQGPWAGGGAHPLAGWSLDAGLRRPWRPWAGGVCGRTRRTSAGRAVPRRRATGGLGVRGRAGVVGGRRRTSAGRAVPPRRATATLASVGRAGAVRGRRRGGGACRPGGFIDTWLRRFPPSVDTGASAPARRQAAGYPHPAPGSPTPRAGSCLQAACGSRGAGSRF